MNKTVLITGASKGIGRETAIYFAKHNYNVVINYLTNEKEALKLKAIIEKNYNVSSMIIKADVSNEIEVKNMLDKVIKEQINITDEEYSFLLQELTDIIKDLYKDDNIDSVYLINYQNSNNGKGTLNIVVLLNTGASYSTYDQLIKEINRKINTFTNEKQD